MSVDDLGLGSLDDDASSDKGIRATFDGRSQYHRLALGIEALILKMKGLGDIGGWLDGLKSLYDHSETFFTDAERSEIEKGLDAADKAIFSSNSFNYNNSAFRAEHNKIITELKNSLHLIHRQINRARHSHGLLVPSSMGSGELDLSSIMGKMGVSNSGKGAVK